jgi:TRAP-type C4-dicarboxylate transport system substrate-binding protein
MIAAICFVAPATAKDKPIELGLSNFFPAPHNVSQLLDAYAQAIAEKSGGKIKITNFHGGTLTPAAQCYDGVYKGLSDLGLSCLSYTRGRFPLSEVVDLPLGYKSGLAATHTADAYYRKFQPKELTDTQIMLLHAHGPGIIHTKKPVTNLDELKGVKLSCTGLSAKIAQRLGAVPVAAPMSERYDSIQRGVSEGGMFPFEALKGFKLAEVVSYTTENYSSSYTTTFFLNMNKDRWAKLSPEMQKVFDEVNTEFVDRFGEGWDMIDKEGREVAAAQGIKVLTLTPEEADKWAVAVRPILDDYVATMKSKNLPGEEALKFCMETLNALQK